MRLHLPPDAAYTCRRCNTCCRRAWRIGLTPDEDAALRRLYPDMPVPQPFTGDDEPGLLAMPRQADGACAFLDEEGCRVHREHGPEAKPGMCRRFPFFLWREGDEAWLHLSHVCPAVQDRSGACGDALEQEAAAWLDRARPLARPREGAKLAGDVCFRREDYDGFVEVLARLVTDDRWPLDDAVAAGAQLCQDLVDRKLDPARPSADPALDLVLSAIAARAPVTGFYRYIVAALVTAVESRRATRPRFAAWREDSARFARLLWGRGRIELPAFGAAFDLRDQVRVPWPRRHTPDLGVVRGLLASHLRRHILLESPDLEYGYLLLVAAYAALKYHARAAAAAAGRDRLIPADLARAVTHAEYHLLLHRRLTAAPFERGPLRGFFRRLLFHPSYVSSLVAF